MRHEMKYFFLGAITTGLIAAGMFALAPLSSQAEQHAMSERANPGQRGEFANLPDDISKLGGKVVVEIDVETGQTVEYVRGGPPPEVQFPLRRKNIDSVENIPGTDMVVIKYTPGSTMVCKWVGGDYKCYSV